MEKVDVAINVYGKPYQTLVTLFSLLKHNADHIDKIYFVEEAEQPHGDSVAFVPPLLGDRVIYHHSPLSVGYTCKDARRLRDADFRLAIRYQYAWENTDKNYLYVCHNDCLFTGNILSPMLEKIQDTRVAGVGLVGQCWNCPAFTAGVCDSYRHATYRPSYEEAVAVIRKHPSPRTSVEMLDKMSPMPFPECRLNEFSCLVSVGRLRDVVFPHGKVLPFGYSGLSPEFRPDGEHLGGTMTMDIGTNWFRGLMLLGYKFIHFWEHTQHGWANEGHGGYHMDLFQDRYHRVEAIAKKYLEENFPRD